MPFLKESISELEKKLNLTDQTLSREFSRYLISTQSNKKYFTPQAIKSWRTGKSKPPVDYIDHLYDFGKSRGHKIIFFEHR